MNHITDTNEVDNYLCTKINEEFVPHVHATTSWITVTNLSIVIVPGALRLSPDSGERYIGRHSGLMASASLTKRVSLTNL